MYWVQLGLSLVEHGETSFVAVMRKDSRLFDLILQLMLYSTDLWLHFHSFLLEKISQLLNKVMKEMVIPILEKSTNTDTNF